MSKKAQRPTYRVEFKGTDIILENVKLVQTPSGDSAMPFTRFDQLPSGGWMITHQPGGLFNEIPAEGIDIVINRQGENRYLYTEDDDGCGITRRITKGTVVKVDKPFLHLDCIERHTQLRSDWRVTWSPSFIEQLVPVKSIFIQPMAA